MDSFELRMEGGGVLYSKCYFSKGSSKNIFVPDVISSLIFQYSQLFCINRIFHKQQTAVVESITVWTMAQIGIHYFSRCTPASSSRSHTHVGKRLAEVYAGALLNLWEYLCTYLCAKERENVETWEPYHLTAL